MAALVTIWDQGQGPPAPTSKLSARYASWFAVAIGSVGIMCPRPQNFVAAR